MPGSARGDFPLQDLRRARDRVIEYLFYSEGDQVGLTELPIASESVEGTYRYSDGGRHLDVYLAARPHPSARLLSAVPDGNDVFLHRVEASCPPGEIKLGRAYARVRGGYMPPAEMTAQLVDADFGARLTYPDGAPAPRVDLWATRGADGLSRFERLTIPPLVPTSAPITKIGDIRCTGIVVAPKTYAFEAAGEGVGSVVGCRPPNAARFVLPGREQLAGATVDDLFALLKAGIETFIVKAEGVFMRTHGIVGGENGRRLFCSVRGLQTLALIAGASLVAPLVARYLT